MESITLDSLNEIRQSGYRPQVVGCFLNNKKILLVYKKEYNLWQLPQGGIDNKETLEQAIVREMTEELGQDFIKNTKPQAVIAEDKVEFPEQTKNSRELKLDNGEIVPMHGKKYFFIPINSDSEDLDISKTEFDDFQWVNFEQAWELAENIYQKGKKRITLNILEELHKVDLL